MIELRIRHNDPKLGKVECKLLNKLNKKLKNIVIIPQNFSFEKCQQVIKKTLRK